MSVRGHSINEIGIVHALLIWSMFAHAGTTQVIGLMMRVGGSFRMALLCGVVSRPMHIVSHCSFFSVQPSCDNFPDLV